MKVGWELGKLTRLYARKMMRSVGFRGDEGTALVEFAVTLPLFIIVVTATVTFSLGLYFLQQVGNATSSAAMALGGEAGLFPNGDPCAAARSFVTGSLPNLDPSKISISMTLTDTTLGSNSNFQTYTQSGTGTGFSCATAPTMEANYPVTLTVTYSYQWMPIFRWLPYFNVSPSSSLSSTQAAIQE
jgi:Flp pilus assembly protein TadG